MMISGKHNLNIIWDACAIKHMSPESQKTLAYYQAG